MTLTHYGKYIRNYSADVDAEGNHVIALNLVTVNENEQQIYGDSTLVVLDQNESIDLMLTDYVSYDEKLVQPNGKLPISFEVKNNSKQKVDQFTAVLKNEEGETVGEQTVECQLSAGDIAVANMVYDLPEQIVFHKLTLQVKADGETDLSNNEKDLFIGYADLEIEGLYLSGNCEEAYLECTVWNNGFANAENVVVHLYYGNEETAFESINMNDMEAGGKKSIKVAIPQEYRVVNPLAAGNVIRAEVCSDTEEVRLDNNEKEFLILSGEEHPIGLNASSIRLKQGESVDLDIVYCEKDMTDQAVIWASNNGEVATVTAKGEITGKGVGETTVTAVSEDGYYTASCRVVVSQKEDQVYTASFAGGEGTTGTRPDSVTGKAGTILVLPVNPYQKAGMLFAGWSDGQNTYEEGSLYRMPYRNVTFTALWNDDGKIDYTITASAGEHGSISPHGEVIVEEKTDQEFVITPDEGYEVEEVLIDGESVGAVTNYVFECVSEDHSIEVSFRKIADHKVYVKRVTLSETEKTIGVGDTLALMATVTPENADDPSLMWSSSDKSIAVVDQTGVVTALKPGETTITAEAKDGSEVTGSCKITVTKAKQKFAGMTSYNKTYGEPSFDLKMELEEGDGNLSYETSDKSVVTISASGKGTIRGAGTAAVRVTAEETENYAETKVDVEITVNKAEQKLEGAASYSKMVDDSDFLLGVTQSDGDGMLRYQSSNSGVVTVNSAGKVSVVGPGTAVITVTAEETDNFREANFVIEITVAAGNENPVETEPPVSTGGPIGTEPPVSTDEPIETEPSTGTEVPNGTNVPPSQNTSVGGELIQPPLATVPVKGVTLLSADKKTVYKVTKSGTSKNGKVTGAEVAYVKCKKQKSSAVIPGKITIGGIQYKVSSIAKNAFKNDYLCKGILRRY